MKKRKMLNSKLDLGKIALLLPPAFRAAASPKTVLKELDHLACLSGTWVGDGFSLISVPDKQHDKPFRLQLNATKEILTFRRIGAPIPNRGSEQGDISFVGLHYFQQISDDWTNEALHIEPGIWLPIPKTTAPKQEATIVRLSATPHGNALLAQGPAPRIEEGRPKIGAVNSIPFTLDPQTKKRRDVTDFRYLEPFLTMPLPYGIPHGASVNPNLVLVRALDRQISKGQTIQKAIVLNVSANPVGDIADAQITDSTSVKAAPPPGPQGEFGGIMNIPFLTTNANATAFAATFWIETVLDKDGREFVQLQYSQTAVLDFNGLKWPHIAVATLVQQ